MMRTALALLSAVSLFACNVIDGGPEASEARTVEPFTRLRVDDGLTATLSPGAPLVTINAPQKVLENVQAVVKDGLLVVRLKPGVIVNTLEGTTEIVITGQGVVALEATGASKITATGVEGSPFRVSASGASKVTVSGTTADARLSASGASTIAADQLVAEVASVDASGASTIVLNASKTIDGTASGASHVTVNGAADFANVSTSGGSSVSHAAQ